MSNFKPGEIVTCGRMGWWKIKSYDLIKKDRVILEMIMDNKGRVPKRPRFYTALTKWCRKVYIDEIKRQKEEDRKRWDTLLFILDPNLIDEHSINKDILADNGLGKEPEYLISLKPPTSLVKN